MYRQILHSLANFTFTMSVSRYSFLNFKVIVGIAKDDKWYSAIDSKSLFWDKIRLINIMPYNPKPRIGTSG